MTAQITLLPGGRLHMNHGPIDLICQAWGTAHAIRTAYEAAATLFPTILPALCAELPHLRAPLPSARPRHLIAVAMHGACSMFVQPMTYEGEGKAFMTPMAAVAGAVADHVLVHMTEAAPLHKACVNNGGDIAFHLTPGHALTCALVTTLANPALDGAFRLRYENSARGIATSGQACKGRRGKSFSFGIADSITILARTAARADAAATIVANATDLPGHPGIERRPATSIDADSDLGARLITWHVPSLSETEVQRSLDNGRQTADHLIRAGFIEGAVLALQGRIVTCLPARQELAA